jgi:hypothetical protein
MKVSDSDNIPSITDPLLTFLKKIGYKADEGCIVMVRRSTGEIFWKFHNVPCPSWLHPFSAPLANDTKVFELKYNLLEDATTFGLLLDGAYVGSGMRSIHIRRSSEDTVEYQLSALCTDQYDKTCTLHVNEDGALSGIQMAGAGQGLSLTSPANQGEGSANPAASPAKESDETVIGAWPSKAGQN